MLLLFYKSILLSSKLSEEEIKSRVENCMRPDSKYLNEKYKLKKLYLQYHSQPYEGKIERNKFKLKRRIPLLSKQKNPPIIIGKIIPVNQETQIQLKIQLSLRSIIFLSFFLGIYFFSIFFIFNQVNIVIHNELLVVPILLYVLMLVNFSMESSAAIHFFKQTFDAEIIKN